jgi:hypothetical protein
MPSISSTNIAFSFGSSLSSKGISIPLGLKTTIPLFFPLPTLDNIASVVVGYHFTLVDSYLFRVHPTNPSRTGYLRDIGVDSHHHQAKVREQPTGSQPNVSTCGVPPIATPGSGLHSVVIDPIRGVWYLDDHRFTTIDCTKGTLA